VTPFWRVVTPVGAGVVGVGVGIGVVGVGAGAVVALTPVPESCTTWGEPAALLFTVTLPVRVPATVGVNLRLIVHVPPAATEVPQVPTFAVA
jgi:hypothetical protein